MKLKIYNLSIILLGMIGLVASCKEDNERVDPLTLSDGMGLTVKIGNNVYTPELFDNYIVAIKRDSLNGSYLEGRKLFINADLSGVGRLQIVLTNWEVGGGHSDGIISKLYAFGSGESTGVRVVLGDSTYTDKPAIYCVFSGSRSYQVLDGFPGRVDITYCNPIGKNISGRFDAACVALSPYNDTVYVQGSFNGLKYYEKMEE